jgi:protein-glutamine gamma-glutamyltransferase
MMDNETVASASQLIRPQSPIAAIVDRYFQVSLFLLIATGAATLISTGRLDALSVLIVSLAIVAKAYLLLKNRDLKIPERWTTYFTLLYVLVFVVDLFMISGSYVTASVHLVLFSMMVKIFSIQRERDYIYLAVLSFLAVLAASVLTVDTVFLAAFCVFILLAVNTFVSMEIRRSLTKAAHTGHALTQTRAEHNLSLSLSTTGAMIVVGIVISSFGLFFLLPRFSAGYLSAYSTRSDMVTGFSDQVNLGAIGRIQQTDAVVMHIQMDAPPPPDLKWRGVALNDFDGFNWKNEAREQEVLESYSGRYTVRRTQIRKHNLADGQQDPKEFRLLSYRVIMEPIGTNVIFLAPVPVEVGGRFREIGVDENGSFTNIDRNRLTESYDAVSQIAKPSLEKLRSISGQYPADIPILYLQIPPRLDQRIADLAAEITKSANTDYDKAVAIESYLHEHYCYTLQLPSQTPKDPVANFLFERKQGHCEYFASSMAIMLRTVGVPSRVVNGFRNGELNDLTGSYIVRARNAHAWVEAYIPAVGWTAFDPTPPDAISTPTTFSRLRLYMDAAQSFWREWIINYDFGHQRELTMTTVSKAQRTAFDLRRWLRHKYIVLFKQAQRINLSVNKNPQEWTILAVLSAIFIGILWKLRWIVRALRQEAITRKPSKAPQKAAAIWYSRMLKIVARKGYQKQPGATPSEFVKTIPEAALRGSVSNFTERYKRARFGESVADAEQLPGLFEEIVGKK